MSVVNFHGVFMRAEMLLVECKGCDRRVALTKEDGLPIFQGSMTEIRSKTWKCSRCGSTEVRVYAPMTKDEAQMWLAGDPLDDERRVKGCGSA